MRIPPEISQVGFRFAVFIAVSSGLVLVWLRPEPGTPGFVISVMTFAIGVGFGTLIGLLARQSQRKH